MAPIRRLIPVVAVLIAPPAFAAGGAPTVKPRLVFPNVLMGAVSHAALESAWRPVATVGVASQLSTNALQLALDLPAAPAPAEAAPEASNAQSLQVEANRPARSKSAGVSYQGVLDSLVITRDFYLPGTESMGLRLIPTSTALAGESAPVVFRPRFIGTGGWVGVDIAARF